MTSLAADLAPAPAFDRWVLEQPWPAAVVLAVAGVIVCAALVRRGEMRRGVVGGAIFALLGCAVLLAGTLIDTRREQAARKTSEFIRAFEAADAPWAERHLSESVVVASGGEIYSTLGRAQLVAMFRNAGWFGIEGTSEKRRGAAVSGPGVVRTQSTVSVRSDRTGFGISYSTWEFTWRQRGAEGWSLVRLECLSMNGQPPIEWEGIARGLGAVRDAEPSDDEGGLRPDAF